MPSPRTHPTASADAYLLGRWFSAARREGLLTLLPPESWHTLSALLSFTCRDGRRSFTVDQLASTLGVSGEAARQRLDELTEIDWQGQPLAVLEYAGSGEIAGATLAPVEALARLETGESTAPPSPEPDLHPIPELHTSSALASQLRTVGLDDEQIESLTQRFSEERIERQLDWLPQRGARNPAALLIRAVEQGWGAPKAAA